MVELEAKKTTAQESLSLKPGPIGTLAALNLLNIFPGFMLKGIRVFKDEKNQLNIKAVNALLFILAFMLVFFYINGISVSLNKIKDINLGNFVAIKDSAKISPEESLLKPFSFYQEVIKPRDIFRMGQKPSLDSADVISSKAAEASQTLKMVGISWSDQPDAMIEDTKSGKTYFVKKGQMVGDFKVVAVYKDRVTLRYGEENIDLR